MDGNRRWAKERGLPQLVGHTKGYEKLKDVAVWARDAGVEELTVYAFSTENWNRSPEEVSYLMDIFRDAVGKGLEELVASGMKIRFIGDHARFPQDIQERMQETTKRTAGNTKGTLIIALSYGGREEILAAAESLRGSDTHITQDSFQGALWSAGLLDPDIIIRTGGEKRLSGFLTWQSVYSELFFLDTKWPDFSKEEFEQILADFAARERRMGK